ncbi:MAG: glycosyltransferase family 4 protein [Deltaproteobacteria bacterium]|nr:glycosyltransferase family 4 protein [Deltaproteobacteria bacterium]
MKKILLLCETLDPGGAERQVVTDANLLAANNWNVTLAYWATGRLVNTINPAVAQFLITSRNWLGRLVSLYFFCRKGRFDLIHAHLTGANLLASVVGRLLNIPVIITEHGLGLWRLNELKFRIVVSVTFKLAHTIACVCIATQTVKIERENADPTKTTIIYNCYSSFAVAKTQISLAARCRHQIRESAIVVGFVGRLIPVKRLDLLLAVAEIIMEKIPNVIFLIVGDGPDIPELRNQVKKRGLANIFRIVGPQTDIAQFYEMMDVFVLTSEREAFSVALLEANASGLPAVVFDVGGNKEIVVHGETGYVVPFADCEQFADRLTALLADDALRKKMGSEAKQRTENNFSQTARLKVLDGMYRETVKEWS